MTPHPDCPRVRACIQALRVHSQPCIGVLYRFVHPRFSDAVDLISGQGAFLHGGRWNWPGLCHAVYGAFSERAALEESISHATRAGVILAQQVPRQMAAFEVGLQNVLDLMRPDFQQQLGLIPSQLMQEPWEALLDQDQEALTHAIGRAAFEAGLEGLLVPCAPNPRETNLVLFRENLRPDSLLRCPPEF